MSVDHLLVFLTLCRRLFAGLLGIIMVLKLSICWMIFFVDLPNACTGERPMAALSLISNRLRIPLTHNKCIGFKICLEYLCIILYSINMEARLPLDKVQRILKFIYTLLWKPCCAKRDFLQLLGHFNFVSSVVLPRS